MQNYETVLIEYDGATAIVAMNRPEVMNAVNEQMLDELDQAFAALSADPAIRSIVLTGSGKSFGSGQDLRDFMTAYQSAEPIVISEHLAKYHTIIHAIRNAPKPVIAMIRGAAAGASCNLALACDLRVAAENARFIEAFARIGLVPDAGGAYFLNRLVGVGKAMELALLADEISGVEAEKIGLVNICVPEDALREKTMELARRLAEGPTAAYTLIKKLIYSAENSSLADSLQLEGELQDLAFATKDHREGVAAFLQKRRAIFTGE